MAAGVGVGVGTGVGVAWGGLGTGFGADAGEPPQAANKDNRAKLVPRIPFLINEAASSCRPCPADSLGQITNGVNELLVNRCGR